MAIYKPIKSAVRLCSAAVLIEFNDIFDIASLDNCTAQMETPYRQKESCFRQMDSCTSQMETLYRQMETLYRQKESCFRQIESCFRQKETCYCQMESCFRQKETCYCQKEIHRINLRFLATPLSFRVLEQSEKNRHSPPGLSLTKKAA